MSKTDRQTFVDGNTFTNPNDGKQYTCVEAKLKLGGIVNEGGKVIRKAGVISGISYCYEAGDNVDRNRAITRMRKNVKEKGHEIIGDRR